MKAATLEERFAAHHLEDPEDTEALKDAAVKAAPLAEEQPAKPDGRTEKTWTFAFSWTDERKKTWEGTFTNKILSIAERQQAAILEAKLCGGLPYDAIDPATRNVNHAIAHMVFSLRDSPPWAKDLRKLEDALLVIAIYQEVASHEATFFGFGEA
jgi:hypothetical protein